MPFLLLVLLTVACLPVAWPMPPDAVGVYGSIGLTWLGVAGIVALAAATAVRTRRQLARDASLQPTLLQRYASRRFVHLVALFAVYGLALYVLGWGGVVQQVCAWGPASAEGAPDTIPGCELLILAPFLVGLILSWVFFYDAERALHDAGRGSAGAGRYWSRRAYVAFHLRQNLALVFAPVLAMMVVNSVPRLFPQLTAASPGLVVGLTIAAGLGMFACLPWVLRLILGLRPLPEGTLRRRLMAAAERHRFRFSNILVWDTGGGMANALVTGILPTPRYVLLTDRLIAEMTPEEVEAVFGHEAGHVKHLHIPYYLAFLFGSIGALAFIWDAVAGESLQGLVARDYLAVLPLVGLLITYVFVVFGFVSRRCERQADLYGCRAVSCARAGCSGHEGEGALPGAGQGLCPTGIRTFIGALEKVADLNGISRDRPGWLQSWQHSTIARRVEFLQRVLADPTLEPRFQRAVGRVKWALFLSLGAVLLVIGVICLGSNEPSPSSQQQSGVQMQQEDQPAAPNR